MVLLDARNEDALDLLADLIEPALDIMSDKEVKALLKEGKKGKAIKHLLKEHKGSVVEILATVKGVDVEEYNSNIIEMTKELWDLINNKELVDAFKVFMSQEQVDESVTSSGPAMENTEADEQ